MLESLGDGFGWHTLYFTIGDEVSSVPWASINKGSIVDVDLRVYDRGMMKNQRDFMSG
jgi:hypothetical protein